MTVLKTNEVYKILISDVLDDEKEYTYWYCIGSRDDYYILHEAEQFLNNNGYSDLLGDKDLDEEFEDKIELDKIHFKQYNGLEAKYYFDKEVEAPKVLENKRKFTLV